MAHQVQSVSPKGGATNFSLGGRGLTLSKPHQCQWGWRKAIEEGKLFLSQKVATEGVTKTFVSKWVSMKSPDLHKCYIRSVISELG